MDITATTPVWVSQRTPLIAKIVWSISLLCSLAGGVMGLMDFSRATSAPQQAAAAAFGCLISIAPYTFAKAVDAISR